VILEKAVAFGSFFFKLIHKPAFEQDHHVLKGLFLVVPYTIKNVSIYWPQLVLCRKYIFRAFM